MKVIKVNLSEDGRANLTGYIQEPSKEMKDLSIKPVVLVFPGGGYIFTSDREAEPIALAYSAMGFQTFVLRYSVGRRAKGYQPLKDASDAIRLIKENATDWFLDPDKIAVCGFSAGGHLAAWVALEGHYKPNALILCYPAFELYDEANKKDYFAHLLIGEEYSLEEACKLNLYNLVNTNFKIPIFIWHTYEDNVVSVKGIIKFLEKCVYYNVPFESHIFQQGEHGLALCNFITANGRKSMVDPHAEKWFEMSVEWLYRIFGEPEIKDKPYEFIPELIDEEDRNFLERIRKQL